MEKKLKRIERNSLALNFLSNCKPSIRKAVIEKSDSDLIYTFCEIVLNVLNGNIKLDESILKKLESHKGCFRKLYNVLEGFRMY